MRVFDEAISRRAFASGTGIALAAGAAALAGLGTGCATQGNGTATGNDRSSGKAKAAAAGKSSSSSAKADGATIARPSTHGRLSVKGAQLVSKTGEAVQLKGFSTHGLAWFPDFVNADCFAQIAGWGANLARLSLYTAENGGWCTDGDRSKLRGLVEDGVSYAQDADMYAIIDWHVLHDLDPNAYIDDAKEFWTETSKRYSSCNNVIYEICNEPNGSTTWEDVKSYAEQIIPIIRENDPRAPILVGTPTWSQDVDKAAADPLVGFDNILYAFHFYAGTHKDSLRTRLRTAIEGGLPVFVSEYGISDSSGTGTLDYDSASTWMQLLDELGVSSACWSLCNKDESSAMIASSCTKTSGFEDEDLSDCGTWFRSMLESWAGGENANEVGSTASNSTSTSKSGSKNGKAKNKKASSKNGATANSGSSGALPAITASAGLSCTANVRQSWESNGKTVNLYDLTIENTSSSTVSDWSVDLTFSSSVNVTDSWNATLTQDGATVHLSPASYNASIDAGAKLTDIGLIAEMG